MIFGIKLRELEQGELPFPREISIIGNELFTNEDGLKKRMLGIKSFTAVGNLSNGIDIWDEYGNSDVLYYIDNSSNSFNEYFRIDGGFIKREVGLRMEDLGDYVLIYPDKELYIKRDGSVKIDDGYIPMNSTGILPKRYIDGLDSMDITDPQMVDSYSCQENFQPHVKGDEIFLRLPTTRPNTDGTLWNNSGVINITPTKSFHFLVRTVGGVRPHVDDNLQTHGVKYTNLGDNWWSVYSYTTTYQVNFRYNYGGTVTDVFVESLNSLTSLQYTWYEIATLVNFQVKDPNVASNINNFRSTWAKTGLSSCPGTDGTLIIPAGADTSSVCYGI